MVYAYRAGAGASQYWRSRRKDASIAIVENNCGKPSTDPHDKEPKRISQ